jgi:hypothetical protein
MLVILVWEVGTLQKKNQDDELQLIILVHKATLIEKKP